MLSKPTRTASPLDLIDSEIIQEQASALGRLGRGLEAALAALREFDAALASPPSDAARTQRATLVAQAGHALWMFVVQREVLRPARQPRRHARLPGAARGAGPHGPDAAATDAGQTAPRRVARIPCQAFGHGRACPGHPDHWHGRATVIGVAGTSPAMTAEGIDSDRARCTLSQWPVMLPRAGLGLDHRDCGHVDDAPRGHRWGEDVRGPRRADQDRPHRERIGHRLDRLRR